MSEQIISKQCRKCKKIKPISEFYKALTNRDRFRNECRVCYSKYQKEYRQTECGKAAKKRHAQSKKGKVALKRYKQSKKGKVTDKRYAQSEKGRKTRIAAIKKFRVHHPELKKAGDAVNSAIRAGRLPRPDSLQCHYCPAQAKEYHHYNGYAPEHWLDVIPVCIPCHNKIPKNKVISATV